MEPPPLCAAFHVEGRSMGLGRSVGVDFINFYVFSDREQINARWQLRDDKARGRGERRIEPLRRSRLNELARSSI